MEKENKETSMPIIFESETSNLVKDKPEGEKIKEAPQDGKKAGRMPGTLMVTKLLFVLLILIIIIELGIGVKVLQTEVPKAPSLQPVSDGTIAVVARNSSVPVGDTLAVEIRVSTGGHVVDGVDAVLKYDPKLIQVDAKSVFEKGSIFEEYPIVNIDNKDGIVRISGIGNDSKGFSGTGSLGIIHFVTKKPGNATLSVEFEKGSTTDSNIIETKTTRDILSSVTNLKLDIGGRNLTESKTALGLGCEGFIQVCQDGSGKQGTQVCQGGKKRGDQCIFDPLLTVSCDSCQVK